MQSLMNLQNDLNSGSCLRSRLIRLKHIIQRMDSVVLAFSGGVDSTFLLYVCTQVLNKDSFCAVIGKSYTYPLRELRAAIYTAKRLQAPYQILCTDEFHDPRFLKNTLHRCYWCKLDLFKKLCTIAHQKKCAMIIDGSNKDDLQDTRMGFKAAKRYKIRHPLIEASLGKEDIRILSRKAGLWTWDKPSFACLASRVAYGTALCKTTLQNIDKAETYIQRCGFRQVRVRDYGMLARIEVPAHDIPSFVRYRVKIHAYLKKLGYTYITLDMQGYKTGSMNGSFKKR